MLPGQLLLCGCESFAKMFFRATDEAFAEILKRSLWAVKPPKTVGVQARVSKPGSAVFGILSLERSDMPERRETRKSSSE
jgi:hypothetical protein